MDTPCLLCSGAFDVVVGRPLGYHVIAGEGNAGNSLKLSGGHSASFGSSRPRQILCEKAKAQQFFPQMSELYLKRLQRVYWLPIR